MSSVPSPIPPRTSPPPSPFVTMHTALVLLTAFIMGLVVGGLTFLDNGRVADAILAGLFTAGGSVPVLRTLIR